MAFGDRTRVGTASGYGVNEFGPGGLASHNGVLYMLGGDGRRPLHPQRHHGSCHESRDGHQV